MIAVDTNILVYAHREDSDWHSQAFAGMVELAEGTTPWAIPWPCLHEFLAIVTHPRIFDPPTPLATALDQVEAWRESPSLRLLSETPGYWERLRKQLDAAQIQGPKVHDARIAAMCLCHGVSVLWTADRDFGSFPELNTVNPLIS